MNKQDLYVMMVVVFFVIVSGLAGASDLAQYGI